MKTFDEIYMDIYPDIYEQAIEDGMSEEQAEAHADEYTTIEAQDRLEAAADMAYECWKDRMIEDE